MDLSRNGTTVSVPLAVGAVIFSGLLVGLGAVQGQSSLSLDASRFVTASGAPLGCSSCGVVQDVREIANAGPGYEVSTVASSRDDLILILLSSLSGSKIGSAPRKIYEVNVRMDDGSVRAARLGVAPQWKAGDRVRFLKGRVESLS